MACDRQTMTETMDPDVVANLQADQAEAQERARLAAGNESPGQPHNTRSLRPDVMLANWIASKAAEYVNAVVVHRQRGDAVVLALSLGVVSTTYRLATAFVFTTAPFATLAAVAGLLWLPWWGTVAAVAVGLVLGLVPRETRLRCQAACDGCPQHAIHPAVRQGYCGAGACQECPRTYWWPFPQTRCRTLFRFAACPLKLWGKVPTVEADITITEPGLEPADDDTRPQVLVRT